MRDPVFYPHPVKAVQIRETHISKVFLTGEFVYKVKKEVNLGFVDYSKLDRRLYFCQQEINLNRRLADGIYLEVVPITCCHGRFELMGEGPAVEYAVKMRQLPETNMMIRRLQAHEVGEAEINAITQRLTDFYAATGGSPKIDDYGSPEAIRRNCEENFSQLVGFMGNIIEEKPFETIQIATRFYLQRKNNLLNKRVQTGWIKDCHGDLRCGHVYFEKGIQIVDCIEFNDRFRYGDIACDLAFLAMDLDFEGFPDAAQALVDCYTHMADDPDASVLFDFYKCYRAMVRAKIACLRLNELESDKYIYRKKLREARQYFALAYRYALQISRPVIWVICGLPASGKSTISDALGRQMQLKVLRSDEIRKQMFDIPLNKAVIQPIGEGIYADEFIAVTYEKLLLQAEDQIAAGRSVILDATYGSSLQRQKVLQRAHQLDANVVFIECVARTDTLLARLRKRKKGPSVSDARVQHFQQLKERFHSLDDMDKELHIIVNTDEPLKQSLHKLFSHLSLAAPLKN
jgi:aminoglycoside phosphotransferase family enzyme/predicted kinase